MQISGDNKPPVFYGKNGLVELARKLGRENHQSVLLVSGKDSYKKSGAEHLLKPILEGRQVTRVCNFENNPQKSDLQRILKDLDGLSYSVIIAVGGGCVIDIAKLIKCFQKRPQKIDEVLDCGRAPEPENIKLFVVPTTAGSGSEATHFAVIYDQGKKFSVAHPRLLPDVVWSLSSLLVSVPDKVAASAALDVFCQGVESYWSIHSTHKSREFAELAIKLSWQNMTASVLYKDTNALKQMVKASYLSGRAINLTKTTAPHAISYALTSFFGVLHGHAVALMLPSIFIFNDGVNDDDLVDKRGCKYVRSSLIDICHILDCRDVHSAANLIKARVCDLGLQGNLKELNITDSRDLDVILKHGFNQDRVNNNPRRLGVNDLREILNAMLISR